MNRVWLNRRVILAVTSVLLLVGLMIWRWNSSNHAAEGVVRSDVAFGQASPDQVSKDDNFVAAVLVIACNRPEVRRCVDSLLKHRPSERKFPVVVSQDCGDEQTSRAIAAYGDKVKYIKHPDLSDIDVPQNMRSLVGYFKLSRHFKWALGQAFDVLGYDAVIIVEDDLEIAPDFFEYFTATRWLLDKDPTIWCVSAWNDNGKEGFVKGNDVLYRSDFFPGLGWMLTRSVWNELRPKWPKAFWDDWMRHPDQHQQRSCIRPEISRTETFGKVGVSNGQFFEQHLKFIKANKNFYPFTKQDLSYLMKKNYDENFIETVYKCPLVSADYLMSGHVVPAPFVRVQYENTHTFTTIAQKFGIMHDLKAGIPRTAYRGVVTFMFKGIRVYLAPPRRWRGYEQNI